MEKSEKFEWAALTGLEHVVYSKLCERMDAMNAMEIYYETAGELIEQSMNHAHMAQKGKNSRSKIELLWDKHFKEKHLPAYPRAEAEKILKEFRKVCDAYYAIPVFTTIIKILEDGVAAGWVKKRTVSTGRAAAVYYLPDELKALVRPKRTEALGHD
jgi:hypothetical protein